MAVVIVLAACGVGAAYGYPMVKARLFKTEITATEVALISPAQASISVTSTGYLVPQILSHVGAKAAGKVARAFIKEGDTVKAGDVLFELDDSDQKSSIAAARARAATARETAKAHVDAARANVLELQPQIDREKKLVEGHANAPATLEDVTARQHSLEVQIKASEADVRSAQDDAHAADADIEPLLVNFKDRTIVAPISGTVLDKPPQAGDMVNPGTPLFDLADFSSIVVETDVPEARVHLVNVGSPCEIVLDAYPDQRLRGAVAELGKKVDRAKATLLVKVRFVDPTALAVPEMSARVSFLTKEIDAASLKEAPKHVVPSAAIALRGGSKVVFAVDQGKLKMLPVEVGAPIGGGFELLDGPPPGTRLVSSPSPDLADGQSVKEKDKED
jgi:RND family efflux transporter MFP subunit